MTPLMTFKSPRVDQRLADCQSQVLDTENKVFLPSPLKEAKMLAPELRAQC